MRKKNWYAIAITIAIAGIVIGSLVTSQFDRQNRDNEAFLAAQNEIANTESKAELKRSLALTAPIVMPDPCGPKGCKARQQIYGDMSHMLAVPNSAKAQDFSDGAPFEEQASSSAPSIRHQPPKFPDVHYFKGYKCEEDCSGHEAGYDWAIANDIRSYSDCVSRSLSFSEGCNSYVLEAGPE